MLWFGSDACHYCPQPIGQNMAPLSSSYKQGVEEEYFHLPGIRVESVTVNTKNLYQINSFSVTNNPWFCYHSLFCLLRTSHIQCSQAMGPLLAHLPPPPSPSVSYRRKRQYNGRGNAGCQETLVIAGASKEAKSGKVAMVTGRERGVEKKGSKGKEMKQPFL